MRRGRMEARMPSEVEAEAWLPGMEPKGAENTKPKRKREKRRAPKDVVPLEIELVPGMKMLVLAKVDRETRRRHGR